MSCFVPGNAIVRLLAGKRLVLSSLDGILLLAVSTAVPLAVLIVVEVGGSRRAHVLRLYLLVSASVAFLVSTLFPLRSSFFACEPFTVAAWTPPPIVNGTKCIWSVIWCCRIVTDLCGVPVSHCVHVPPRCLAAVYVSARVHLICERALTLIDSTLNTISPCAPDKTRCFYRRASEPVLDPYKCANPRFASFFFF